MKAGLWLEESGRKEEEESGMKAIERLRTLLRPDRTITLTLTHLPLPALGEEGRGRLS